VQSRFFYLVLVSALLSWWRCCADWTVRTTAIYDRWIWNFFRWNIAFQ